MTDDGNEDSSPDFFRDAAGRITRTGWTLEIRIPFSSLRYERADPQTWGIPPENRQLFLKVSYAFQM